MRCVRRVSPAKIRKRWCFSDGHRIEQFVRLTGSLATYAYDPTPGFRPALNGGVLTATECCHITPNVRGEANVVIDTIAVVTWHRSSSCVLTVNTSGLRPNRAAWMSYGGQPRWCRTIWLWPLVLILSAVASDSQDHSGWSVFGLPSESLADCRRKTDQLSKCRLGNVVGRAVRAIHPSPVSMIDVARMRYGTAQGALALTDRHRSLQSTRSSRCGRILPRCSKSTVRDA